MKKLCLILAIVSLLSCVLFSCSGREDNVETSSPITERVTEAPRRIKWSDIEEAAMKDVESGIKARLLNPSSYTKNSSVVSETFLYKSSYNISYIYFKVVVDYSAQNRMGGFERKNEYGYYWVPLNEIGKDYNGYSKFLNPSHSDSSLHSMSIDSYMSDRKNGTEWSKYDLAPDLQ